MRWAYDNLWDDYTITASSEQGNYPASNTQNNILTTTWRSDTDGGESIVIDAGAGNTITCTCAVVSGHNLTSGATIKFEQNATDSWGAPSVSETITYRATHAIKFFTSGAYRFARFYFDDTSNPDEFIEIGRLFCGTYLQVNPSSLIGFQIENIRNDIVTITDQHNVYATPGIEKRQFSYNFPWTASTIRDSMRTVYSTVGKYKPFWHCNYDTSYGDIDIAYVVITNNLTETWIGNNKITYSIDLREVG